MSRVTGFEKNAGFELLKHAGQKGMHIRITDSEEGERLFEEFVETNGKLRNAWEAATCVDECYVFLAEPCPGFPNGELVGWARLNHCNDGPEVIFDHDHEKFVDAWATETKYGQGAGGPDYN